MNTEKFKSGLKVCILCGGKGTRLGSLTKNIPKPLIPINGKPILSYIIDHIKNAGIKDVIIASGYKSDKISDYFSSNFNNLDIQIVNSGDVDIIQRIKDMAYLLQGDFILLYGDTVSNVDLNRLIDYHHSHSGKATVTLWPLQSQFGILEVNSKGMISSYEEKPVLDKWINIGYFYFEHSVLSMLNVVDRFDEFIQYLVKNDELNGFKHQGLHITVNTMKELEEAEKNIEKFTFVEGYQ